MLKAYFRFKTFITVLRHISNLKVKFPSMNVLIHFFLEGGGGGELLKVIV